METGHNRQAQLARPALAHPFQQSAKVEGDAQALLERAVGAASPVRTCSFEWTATHGWWICARAARTGTVGSSTRTMRTARSILHVTS